MIPDLFGKVVIVTGMRKLPKYCAFCRYYDNMGGTRGYRNNGACIVLGYQSTEDIQVTKMRLDNCPLHLVKRKKRNPLKTNRAIAWLNWMMDYSILRHTVDRDSVNLAIEALKDQLEKEEQP